jgi:asparagine synthase (glutamine-hydrolysing)
MAAEPPTADLVVRLASQFDEPIADSSMVPTHLVSRLVRSHAGVALGGDGGDELFGGYPHYSWLVWQERAARWVPAPVRRAVSFMAPALPAGMRGRNHLIGLGGGLPRANAHFNLYFDQFTRRRLLAPMLRNCANGWQSPEELKSTLFDRKLSPVQASSRVDFQTYLVDDILVKVDRSSMLASLEVRAPFLDPRLIEFAFGRVPDALRANGATRRVLPRRLALRLIGPTFDADRKQGFSLPLDQWFRGEWSDFLRSTLQDASPELFDRRVIGGLFHAQRAGFRNSQRLFSLAMFELWRREYRIAV